MTDKEKLTQILNLSSCINVNFSCFDCPIIKNCDLISVFKSMSSMTSLRKKIAVEKLDDMEKIEKIESIINKELSE